MDRRTFLTAMAAALAAAGASSAATPPGPVPAPSTASPARTAISAFRALKGAAHGGDDALALRQIRSLNASWYYSWGSAYTVTTKPAFVPMVWSANALLRKDALGDVARQLPQTRTKHLLAFNEPDHPGQASMSVDEAIRLWPHLQSTGLRLGSPATVDVEEPVAGPLHGQGAAGESPHRLHDDASLRLAEPREFPRKSLVLASQVWKAGLGYRIWGCGLAGNPGTPLPVHDPRDRLLHAGCGRRHAPDALRRTVCVEGQGSQ